MNTKSLHINHHTISLPCDIYSATSSGFSGDVSVNLLGSTSETIDPVWTISGSESYPVTVLSISLYGWYKV